MSNPGPKKSGDAGETPHVDWNSDDIPRYYVWRTDGPPDEQREFPFVREVEPPRENKTGDFEF
jgi:hypothetical protein